jgi:hypothetical protein
MKKLLLIAIPALSLSLFSFAPAGNFGVSLLDDGNYHVAQRNSITPDDKEEFVATVKKIYGLEKEGDFTVEMQAKPGFNRRTFIGRIKILSNFEEFVYRDETSTPTLSAAEGHLVEILEKYATVSDGTTPVK